MSDDLLLPYLQDLDDTGPCELTLEDLDAGNNHKLRHRFVMQMLRYGHLRGGQTKAAIEAGYSPATAKSQAARLMNNPEVRAHLKMELEKRAERTNVTPDRIIKRLEEIAFADIHNVATWENNKITVRDALDLDPSDTASIAAISETQIKGGGRKIEIKQHDQLKALELLGKTLCMFKDKQEDPTAQIGGVLRVSGRQSIEEWEAAEGVAEQPRGEEP